MREPSPVPSTDLRVAGVHAPAFVERTYSVVRTVALLVEVSPGFTPRPSLSEGVGQALGEPSADPGVAGVHAPAFVERGREIRVDVSDDVYRCRRGSRPGLR